MAALKLLADNTPSGKSSSLQRLRQSLRCNESHLTYALSSSGVWRDKTTLSLPARGRNFGGMDDQVRLPMITAFRRPEACTDLVVSRKKSMSVRRDQGSLPSLPMPPSGVTATTMATGRFPSRRTTEGSSEREGTGAEDALAEDDAAAMGVWVRVLRDSLGQFELRQSQSLSDRRQLQRE
jgi:hypothetical protein